MDNKKEILILDNQYIDEICNYIEKTTFKSNMQLSVLMTVLENIVEYGIVKGETAEVLSVFMQRVSSLEDCIKAFGTEYINILNDFKKNIDDVDILYSLGRK